MRCLLGIFAAASVAVAGVGQALAAGIGQPEPWQLGMQQAVTPIAHNIQEFHTFLLWLITIITIFVLGLMVWIVVKFNAKANPTPSKTTHNTMIEVVWTIVPILILLAVAVPSFRLLFQQRTIPEAALTIKATGHQWYWEYDYPDNGEINFTSTMLTGDDLAERRKKVADAPRLLATDYPVVVPEGTTVRLIVTAAPDGVIHAWAMPSFGSKIDAVPGRLNEMWFNAEKTGIYYGQCSELCGKDHAFMPIELHVVSKDDFAAWASTAASDVDEATDKIYAGISAKSKLAAKAAE